MPVSIQIEEESGIAIVRCTGTLRLDDAQQAAVGLWKAPGWQGRAAVWDFRESEFDVSSSDAREIARFILQSQPSPPPAKMAFVTQSDVDFGMARVFGAYREDSATAFRVFRDYEDALRWARSLASPET